MSEDCRKFLRGLKALGGRRLIVNALERNIGGLCVQCHSTIRKEQRFRCAGSGFAKKDDTHPRGWRYPDQDFDPPVFRYTGRTDVVWRDDVDAFGFWAIAVRLLEDIDDVVADEHDFEEIR